MSPRRDMLAFAMLIQLTISSQECRHITNLIISEGNQVTKIMMGQLVLDFDQNHLAPCARRLPITTPRLDFYTKIDECLSMTEYSDLFAYYTVTLYSSYTGCYRDDCEHYNP
jgi:hypothetical protein